MRKGGLVLLGIISASVHAGCPNACSGHGNCDTDDQCECYKEAKVLNVGGNEESSALKAQWTGADCSQLTCPRGISWNKVSGEMKHTKGAECSDMGICDRSTGRCECFGGFEGLACHRTTCPTDCSGHGVCKSNLQFAESYARAMSTVTNIKHHNPWCDGVVDNLGVYDSLSCARNIEHLDDYYNTFMATYDDAWDSGLQYGCECDDGYHGPDCSLRECPSEPDVGDPSCDGITMSSEDSIFIDTDDEEVELSTNYKNYLDLYVDGGDVWNAPQNFKPVYAFFPDITRGCASSNYGHLNLVDGTYKTAMDALESSSAYLLLVNQDWQNCDWEWPASVVKVPYCNGQFSSVECSGRGLCDTSTGICNCFDGYTGKACNEVEELA